MVCVYMVYMGNLGDAIEKRTIENHKAYNKGDSTPQLP